MNDVLVKSSTDSIYSILTVKEFGDIKAGDVLDILAIEHYLIDNTDKSGAIQTHSIFYEENKQAYFTYKSVLGTSNDRILMFKMEPGGKPKATYITKDAPNCLAIRKDTNGVPRPIYGSLDGYIYLMDQANYNVNGNSYIGEFQTPHMDMGFIQLKSGSLSDMNKNFDFLSLKMAPLGDWNVYADIFIDGNLYETVTIPMTGDDVLADVNVFSPNDFMLAETPNDPQGSFLAGEELISVQVPLHGCGRTISIRIYNAGLDEGFKIATMFIGFRPSGQQAQRS
jgi:hypothetical protein